MRMMQYDVKLNRDDGTGYYVSGFNDEEEMRLFNNKGLPIEMKILSHRGTLTSDINAVGGSKRFREKLEKELQEHLEEIFSGEYLDWRLTCFEICAECVILEYYKPDGDLRASIVLSAASLQAEFYVPGRNEDTIEKYTIQQSNSDYENGRIYSHTEVTEQINGIRRDLRFTHDTNDDKLFADRYVTITEYVG